MLGGRGRYGYGYGCTDDFCTPSVLSIPTLQNIDRNVGRSKQQQGRIARSIYLVLYLGLPYLMKFVST